LFQDLNEFALVGIDYNTLDPKHYKDVFTVPLNYKEAWYHSCPFQQKRWQEAITKELN
jgi:hypothetical protein